MSIMLWLIVAIASVSLVLLRWFFRQLAKAGGTVKDGTRRYVKEKIELHERKSAAISVDNWYDKASITCGETVDALLNDKIGTTERVVRSMAAKLGFAGTTTGLFSIASLFGTASTGTAISTLSGAAFNSAALKWLGLGSSMAVGGWVVFLISLVGAVVFYVLAKLTFGLITGQKRKLKHLDDQEKRVVTTLKLLAVGFRKQAERERQLRPVSAVALNAGAFEPLCCQLMHCSKKVADWPQIPRDRLRKQIRRIQELSEFLDEIASPPEAPALGMVTGAEGVNAVSVTILKLLSNPVPKLNNEEILILEAIRQTDKRKLKNASLEVISEYIRLRRFDRLRAQMEKARRIYCKLSKKRETSPASDEYTVVFIENPDQSSADVLFQNIRTGDVSASNIEHRMPELLHDLYQGEMELHIDTSKTFAQSPDQSHRYDESQILENLSIAAMIMLAKSAGAYLSGRGITENNRNRLVETGAVTLGTTGLSQLIF